MCKQTCQVSLNLRESPEMAGDLQVSRKCQKISRNRGNLIDLDLQPPGKKFCHYPPPHRIGPASGNYGHFCYYPPPTESGRPPEITENLPGGIGRVVSAGWCNARQRQCTVLKDRDGGGVVRVACVPMSMHRVKR